LNLTTVPSCPHVSCARQWPRAMPEALNIGSVRMRFPSCGRQDAIRLMSPRVNFSLGRACAAPVASPRRITTVSAITGLHDL
jgi:hypothetical protein